MISKETTRHYRVLLSNLDPHTQAYRVLKHILDNGSIRQDIAWEEYGFSRLGAVIFNLHNAGVNFKTEWRIDEATKKPMKFITYLLDDSYPDEKEVEQRKLSVKRQSVSPARQKLISELTEKSKKLSADSLEVLRAKADWLLTKESEQVEQLSLF